VKRCKSCYVKYQATRAAAAIIPDLSDYSNML
jgi:hypothetical protein